MKNLNKTSLFLLLTMAICFIGAGTFHVLGGKYSGIQGTLLASIYMFVPALSAFIVEKVIHKENIRKSLFISFKINRWFFIAWLIPAVVNIGAFGVSLLLPDVSYSPGMEGMFSRFENLLSPEQLDEMKTSIETMPLPPFVLSLLQGLLAGITLNAIFGFGEELGWRGFLVKQLQNKGFIRAALLIGMVWGVWHFPIILMGHNYPQHPVGGVFMMIAWCILLSPLFLYITLKAKSVIAAAIMHGTLNGTAGLGIMMIEGGNDLTVGTSGIAGFIALAIITICFFIYDRFISRENIMTKQIIINY